MAWYYLTRQNDRNFYYDDMSISAIPLNMDGTTTFRLDWSEGQEPLSAGHYYLGVVLQDNYPEEMLTPMVCKFHNRQHYILEFTIN